MKADVDVYLHITCSVELCMYSVCLPGHIQIYLKNKQQ